MKKKLIHLLSIVALAWFILPGGIASATTLAEEEVVPQLPASGYLDNNLTSDQTYDDKQIEPAWFGSKLVNGVGDYGRNVQYYSIEGTTNPTYINEVKAAMDSWNNSNNTDITTPIAFAYTDDVDKASIRFKYQNVGPVNYHGMTYFYDQRGLPVYDYFTGMPLKDYAYSEIVMNTYYNFTDDFGYQHQSIAAHEAGHAFGLAHAGEYDEEYPYNQPVMRKLAQRGIGPNAAELKLLSEIYQ